MVHYSSSFQYFFSIYYGPYSDWKFLIFKVYLFINFFENSIVMIMIMKGAPLAGLCSLPYLQCLKLCLAVLICFINSS